ncbi:MAG: hypothetical protein ACYS32_15835 [Planctomycetota bacterium]
MGEAVRGEYQANKEFDEHIFNWSTSPAMMTQILITVKEFLDKELRKYKTWDTYCAEIGFLVER